MSSRTFLSGMLSFALAASGAYALQVNNGGTQHVASSHSVAGSPPPPPPLSPPPIVIPPSPQGAVTSSPPPSATPSIFQTCIQEICVDLPAFSPEFNACIRECFARGIPPTSRPATPPPPPPLPLLIDTPQRSSMPAEVTLGSYCISSSQERTGDRTRCDTPLRQGAFLFPALASKPSIPVDQRLDARFATKATVQSIPVEDIVAEAIKRILDAQLQQPEDSIAAITLRETKQNLQETLRVHGPSNTWSPSVSSTIRREIALQLRLADQTLQARTTPTRTIEEFISTLGIIFQRLPAFLKAITETQIVTGAAAERIFGEYHAAREALLNARSQCTSDPESDTCMLAIWRSIETLSRMRWVEPLVLENADVANTIHTLFRDLEDQWNAKTSGPELPKPKLPYLE